MKRLRVARNAAGGLVYVYVNRDGNDTLLKDLQLTRNSATKRIPLPLCSVILAALLNSIELRQGSYQDTTSKGCGGGHAHFIQGIPAQQFKGLARLHDKGVPVFA